MLGHTGAPMLHVGISYSFEKKKRLFIVDYIKPSPVYQVKCKLVYFVSITYYITCTFACEFSINFLFADTYCNSLLGCSSAEDFMNTFADVLINEVEIMRSQFAHSMCIV